MDVITSLRPGQPGTRLMAHYGSTLLRVRHRNDPLTPKRYKTVELIVVEQPWEPSTRPSSAAVARRTCRKRNDVLARHSYTERDLRARIEQVGGRWIPDLRLWSMPRRYAIDTMLKERIVRIAE